MISEPSERHPVDRLAEEFVARYRGGERPSISEYAQRYPDLAGELQELLTALVLMEQHGPAGSAVSAEDEAGGTGDSSTRRRIPEQLGEYRILREIGRGGMGFVYEAVQESLGRHVALKVLPSATLMDPTRLKRFQREVHAAAMLHHTNIVPVFGVGESDGIRYYAMQFIQGQSLDAVLEELQGMRAREAKTIGGPLFETPGGATRGLLTGSFELREPPPPDQDEEEVAAAACEPDVEAARASASTHVHSLTSDIGASGKTTHHYYRSVAQIGVQVADALAYAHGQGILHRDIKPSNLLLDLRGTVWVTDFGLAKAEGMEELTHTGDIVGTLRYMPPERFQGHGDARADVYSLGLTLYELLTLRPAFDAPDRAALVRQIAQDSPPRPRKVDPRIPRDLETIVLKACAKEPARRYATASGLAEDLRRFLVDRPIEARRTAWWEHGWRWCRRNPGIAGASAAAVASLLIGLGVALWQWQRAQHSFHRAEANYARAQHDFELALRAVDQMLTRVGSEHLLVVPHMEQARRGLLIDALRFYEDLLQQADDRPEARLEMARAHWRVANIHGWLGDFAPAAKHYDQALRLTQDASTDGSASNDWRQLVGAIHHHRGWLRDHLEQISDAENDYRSALLIWEELVAEMPASPELRYRLAFTLLRLGGLLSRTSRPEVETFQRRALALAETLRAEQPEHRAPERLLVGSLNDLAVTLQRRGDLTGAEKLHRRALEFSARLTQATNDANDRLQLANVQGDLAFLLGRRQGSHEEVGRLYEQSLGAKRRLADEFPTAPEYRIALANVLQNHGIWLLSLRRGREAEAAFIEATAAWRVLADKHPQIGSYQHKLGGSLHNHARGLLDRGEPAAARPLLAEAIARGQQALQSNPDNTDYLDFLSKHYKELGRVLVALKLPGDAERLARERLVWAQEAVTRQASAANRVALAGAHEELGRAYREGGRLDEAEKAYAQSIAVWRQLTVDSPANADYRSELGAILNNATLVHEKQARWNDMIRLAEEAINHQEAALKVYPTHSLYLERLGRHYGNLADAQFARGEHALVARSASAIQVRLLNQIDDYWWGVRLARCIPLAEKDENLPQAERDRLAREYADGSLAFLRSAQQKNSNNLPYIHTHAAFQPLRTRPDFQELLAAVPMPVK